VISKYYPFNSNFCVKRQFLESFCPFFSGLYGENYSQLYVPDTYTHYPRYDRVYTLQNPIYALYFANIPKLHTNLTKKFLFIFFPQLIHPSPPLQTCINQPQCVPNKPLRLPKPQKQQKKALLPKSPSKPPPSVKCPPQILRPLRLIAHSRCIN